MIKTGIVGGSGYTAGELIRILIAHPEVVIDFICSTSNAGKPVYAVHNDLLGDISLKFSSKINREIDVLFLCLGHGNSARFLSQHTFKKSVKIIDLSRDFRHKEPSGKNSFVYGLPEINKDKISSAQYIANPGCFASGIQLALLPLAKKGLLQSSIHVHAITGSTGAGRGLKSTSHFSWRNNNISIYKAFSHQHITEINESLRSVQASWNQSINFIPVRGSFSRGIFTTAYTFCSLSNEIMRKYYEYFYKNCPFVEVNTEPIHLKQVVNTNKCILYLERHGDQLLITSIIDNLLKGASGQAVQNMNLMFGFEETTGLKLKSIAF